MFGFPDSEKIKSKPQKLIALGTLGPSLKMETVEKTNFQ